MLRGALAAGKGLGLDAKRYMDRGALVPDEVIIDLMRERLARPDATRGFIVDGFPRTIAQAEALASLLKDSGQALDRVIYFEISEPELLRRLTGGRICRRGQEVYHLLSAPPRRADGGDKGGGERFPGGERSGG